MLRVPDYPRNEAIEVNRSYLPYKDALSWLYGLQQFGIKPGLESIGRLLAALDILKSAGRVIHVAGTNGKGSVCAMVESILRAHGYRTGLFTSPHLVTFRERIRVNDDMISEDDVTADLNIIRNLIRDWDPHPTFFEINSDQQLYYHGIFPAKKQKVFTAFALAF